MTILNEHQEELTQEMEQDIKDLEKKEMLDDDCTNCEVCNCVVYKKDTYKLDDIIVCEECYYND